MFNHDGDLPFTVTGYDGPLTLKAVGPCMK